MEVKFNTFEDIKHTPLRAYNIAVMLSNIRQDMGAEKAKEYIELLDHGTRKQVYIIMEWVKRFGTKNVQAMVTKDVQFTDEEFVGDPVA